MDRHSKPGKSMCGYLSSVLLWLHWTQRSGKKRRRDSMDPQTQSSLIFFLFLFRIMDTILVSTPEPETTHVQMGISISLALPITTTAMAGESRLLGSQTFSPREENPHISTTSKKKISSKSFPPLAFGILLIFKLPFPHHRVSHNILPTKNNDPRRGTILITHINKLRPRHQQHKQFHQFIHHRAHIIIIIISCRLRSTRRGADADARLAFKDRNNEGSVLGQELLGLVDGLLVLGAAAHEHGGEDADHGEEEGVVS